MKSAAGLIVVAALTACNLQSAPPPTPSPTSAAETPAADLRTHLDLLLGEQVMIVAKESAAAVNHSDEYTAYTALLSTNATDLTALFGRAFGATAAGQFNQVWTAGNAYLVDYAIGVVTHNDGKANAAISGLNGTFVPQFSQLIAGASKLPLDPVTQLITTEAQLAKALIDADFTGNFKSYYDNLHLAYVQTSKLGDALAGQIAADFPDKFPGDPSVDAVKTRVALNLALQEHSYLATMATDATVAGRDGEKGQALAALSDNATGLRSVVDDQRLTLALSQEQQSTQTYATSGDAAAKAALTDTFVTELASISRASRSVVANHVAATIRVIDDQRSKAASVAADDRAAATSTEPIADALG